MWADLSRQAVMREQFKLHLLIHIVLLLEKTCKKPTINPAQSTTKCNVPKHLFKQLQGRDSTTCLSSLFQWWATLSGKKYFLIPNLNFPWYKMRPFTRILLLGRWGWHPPHYNLLSGLVGSDRVSIWTVSKEKTHTDCWQYVFYNPGRKFVMSGPAKKLSMKHCCHFLLCIPSMMLLIY